MCRLDRVTSYVCDISDLRARIVCCINWWANHVKDFPNLARMARQYLGVPATSATVERLFSVVGFAFADCESLKAPRRWPTSPSALRQAQFEFAYFKKRFNDGGGAHVNDIWLFVMPPFAICMLCDRLLAWTVTADAGRGFVGAFSS